MEPVFVTLKIFDIALKPAQQKHIYEIGIQIDIIKGVTIKEKV